MDYLVQLYDAYNDLDKLSGLWADFSWCALSAKAIIFIIILRWQDKRMGICWFNIYCASNTCHLQFDHTTRRWVHEKVFIINWKITVLAVPVQILIYKRFFSRPPYNVEGLNIIYNVFLIFVNAYIIVETIICAKALNYGIFCNGDTKNNIDPMEMRVI